MRRAIRLGPVSPAAFLAVLGLGLGLQGEFEETVEIMQLAAAREPEYSAPYFILAWVSAALGRGEEARAAAAGFHRVNPHVPTLAETARRYPFKDPKAIERMIGFLQEAGID